MTLRPRFAPLLVWLVPLLGCPGMNGAPDGGTGSCQVADPCAGEDVTSEAVAFLTDPMPTLAVGDVRLEIGVATRLDVQTTLGFGEDERANAFRQNHCDLRLQLQYIDDVTGDNFDGSPNGDDVLARVITVPGSTVEAGGLTLGMTAEAAESALGAGATVAESPWAKHITDRARGLTALALKGEDAGGAAEVFRLALSIATPERDPDTWGQPVVLDSGDLGEGLGQVSTRSSTFENLQALLGPPMAEGVAESSLLAVEARVGTWPHLGLRAAGVCTVLSGCGRDTRISSILLSAPFVGTGEGDVGVFAPRSAVEAHFQSDGTDVDGITVFSGTVDTGFTFSDELDCVERAELVVLDQRTVP